MIENLPPGRQPFHLKEKFEGQVHDHADHGPQHKSHHRQITHDGAVPFLGLPVGPILKIDHERPRDCPDDHGRGKKDAERFPAQFLGVKELVLLRECHDW